MQQYPSFEVEKSGHRLFPVAISALLVALTTVSSPAVAAIQNTVTATATAPNGAAGGITATDTEDVDVANPAPAVQMVKTWSFAPGGDVNGDGNIQAGDTVLYAYVVTNSGNTSLTNIGLTDAHDGTGAPLSFVMPTSVTTDAGSAVAGTLNDSADNPGDNVWDKLGPGDVLTYTSTYVIDAGDFSSPQSADGDIDNTATLAATSVTNAGTVPVSTTASTFVPLVVNPSMTVAKVADDTTDVVAGQVITYTYTVTNNGNVPLSAITLADTHNGTPGALVPAFQSFSTNTGSINAGNTITVLQPGDVAVFTATYTVTQQDIDTRQ